MDSASTLAAQPQWPRFDQLPGPGDSAHPGRPEYAAFFGPRSLLPTEDDASSSSGSDLSDQFEASSQASYSTDITEPDSEASDDLSGTARFIESISFGQPNAGGPGARLRQDLTAAAAVHSKLAALDAHDAHAARVPVGCHRSALSRVDSVCQTRSQRFPVLRCTTGPAVTQRRGSAEIKTAGPHARRSALSDSWSAPPLPRTGSSYSEHPRRSVLNTSWSPPSLVREEDRRKVMVEQLVETASQLIAAIWPASVALPGATQGSVISLPFFVRETLRRSRTSYNSLQVALYYIVKLRAKGKMPFCDAAAAGKEQSPESQALRAMQCGRRMLLTSLILASKYLQDRNFSARAWSKISGLPVSEITSNEMAVLQALDWKLHVTETDFSHWSVVVHKSTEVIKSRGDCRPLWQQVIKLHHDGASIEALALAMRPMQPVHRAAQCPPSLHSLPSPASSVSSGSSPRSVDSFPIFDARPTGFAQGMLATPACSPPLRELGAYAGGPPPPAPHLGTNLSTPSLTPLGSSHANTPAAFVGLHGADALSKMVAAASGGITATTAAAAAAAATPSTWAELRMLSPQSLSYGSDDEAAIKPLAGFKRRVSQTGAEDELSSSSSPPKISRRA